jgi:amino acid transporter
MSDKNQLSLCAAIIINVNIIIGSGVFINTAELAKRAGACSSLSYAIVGLLLFPLILSFVRLLTLYPVGGFYVYASKTLNPFIGFLSTWGYFTTKLSSATLAIHIFVLLMQKTFPIFALCNPFIADVGILFAIVSLNMLNIRTGSAIQNYLMILKLFPLFLVIGSGLFLINWSNISAVHQLWEGIPSTIPLVLHAMLGFETACSISRNIANPKKNAPRAVLLSYGLVMVLYMLYQTLIYAILGDDLTAQADYRGVFPLLVSKFAVGDAMRNFLGNFIHLSIALSALSAGFGMFYANMWNLYSLAERNHTYIPTVITRLNQYSVPMAL